MVSLHLVHLLVFPAATLPPARPIHPDTHHQCMGEMEAAMAVVIRMILPSEPLQVNVIARSSQIGRIVLSYLMMPNTVSGGISFEQWPTPMVSNVASTIHM